MQQHSKWMEKASAVRNDLLRAKASFPKRLLAAMPTPGVPPSPMKACGSHEAVAQHANQWGPHTTLGAHFMPDQLTMMIGGRPMQASSLPFVRVYSMESLFR